MVDYDFETFSGICHLNDVKPSCGDQFYKSIKKLKLFYNGVSKFIELQQFTNLRELVVIGQPIAELKDLMGCKYYSYCGFVNVDCNL